MSFQDPGKKPLLDIIENAVRERGFYLVEPDATVRLWTCDAWKGWWKKPGYSHGEDRMALLLDVVASIIGNESGLTAVTGGKRTDV